MSHNATIGLNAYLATGYCDFYDGVTLLSQHLLAAGNVIITAIVPIYSASLADFETFVNSMGDFVSVVNSRLNFSKVAPGKCILTLNHTATTLVCKFKNNDEALDLGKFT